MRGGVTFQQQLSPFLERQFRFENDIARARRQERVVRVLVEALASVAERKLRRSRRLAAGACFLAAAAGVSLWLNFWSEGRAAQLSLEVKGADAELTDATGVERAVPGRLHSLDSTRVVATTAGGTAVISAGPDVHALQLRLDPDTEIALPEASPRTELSQVRLARGRVSLSVPKLPSGKQFIVMTPRGRVVVHGTQFSVALPSVANGLATTCVQVTEGEVSVEDGGRQVARLAAGGQWGCTPAEPQLDAVFPRRAPSDADRPKRASLEVRPENPSQRKIVERQPVPSSSTLEAENRMLAEALTALREHNNADAEQLLQALLVGYPNSPLRAEAARLLAKSRQRSPD